MMIDRQTQCIFGGLFGLLLLASIIGQVMKRTLRGESSQKVVANLNARINAWWIMCLVLTIAMIAGKLASVILFGLVSFLALREFITLTPTKRNDHRALFWAFFVILPYQYWLVATSWYGMFTIMIPVYAYLFIPIRNSIAGDTERFLERTSKIQWGLMACVYFVSYVPGLLDLEIPGYAKQNVKLLFFLIFVVQFSDVMQYVWGKCCGRHPIAPKVSPNKTLEGLVGGGLTAIAAGTALWKITPFSPWQAALMSALIVAMGFCGGLVMSAIKRDRGVKDYGEMIPGHGGIMDRIDSLCFAAPVFFHLTRYFFT